MVLTIALEHNWVPDAKHYFSQKQQVDVGTPAAVDMLLRHPEWHVGKIDCVPLGDLHNLKRLMIACYLLGTNFIGSGYAVPDKNGSTQLEGELKRYWAQKYGNGNPDNVRLNIAHVTDYCRHQGLDFFGIPEMFAGKLGLAAPAKQS